MYKNNTFIDANKFFVVIQLIGSLQKMILQLFKESYLPEFDAWSKYRVKFKTYLKNRYLPINIIY